MCGIVGYVGKQEAQPILLEGLKTLEYRGYDSAGIAVTQADAIAVQKRAGRVADLEKLLADTAVSGTCGISHTRWATHGGVTDENAHPHTDASGDVAVVHNGVIENYNELKQELTEAGVVFKTETDTEVIAHLLGQELAHATSRTEVSKIIAHVLERLRGTYGLLIVIKKFPDTIFAARLGSPLLLGMADHGYIIASDATALGEDVREVMYLEDGDIVTVTPDGYTFQKTDTVREVHAKEQQAEAGSLGEFDHFMQKEMFEQPQTIAAAMRGHVKEGMLTPRLSGLNISPEEVAEIDRIIFTACGTSYHAALVAEYWIEELAGLPVEVEYASELRYRKAPVGDSTLIVAISQSGETADTLAAIREFKQQGKKVRGIVNVIGSSIARETEGGMYLHAGPEIGVASTKAFTSQLTILFLLALYFARHRGLSEDVAVQLLTELHLMPEAVEVALATSAEAARIAEKYKDSHTMLYLGRGTNYPIALEGALKLKEVSYIHAEGYPAAEMKHGPIALVDEHTPSVIINTAGVLYEKVMNNLEEIKARGGPIIAVASEGDALLTEKADDVLYVPHVPELLQPFVTVIPLQLLAYHMAVVKGADVDKPRNLAKSVTVE